MSKLEEQFKAFLEKVNGDSDAFVEIAKAAEFAITPEEIQSIQSGPAKLSDEELEGAAGGTGDWCRIR